MKRWGPTADQIDLLTSAVWNSVFAILDAELDLLPDDAGRAAFLAESAVRKILTEAWMLPLPAGEEVTP